MPQPAAPTRASDGTRAPPAPTPPRAPVELYAFTDLPDEPRSRELSGIAWDDEARTLWAVQDETPNIVPLVADAAFTSFRFGGPAIHVEADGRLDLEGIALLPDGFLVSSEIGPRILETDRAGRYRRDIPLPAKFSEAVRNKSLESLSVSPDKRWLFTTTELGLPRDGPRPTTRAGSHVRILRVDRTNNESIEHAYALDPVAREGEDYGIADLAALSADELLVLERGYSKGVGNRVRIYAVGLSDADSVCSSVESLGDLPVLPKRLLVDLATLPVPAAMPPARQPEPTPLLDNFEGLAVGPLLPDGRRALFLVSDDNARSVQYARVLVLALARGGMLGG